MNEESIRERIASLVDEEHRLRTQVQAGQISTDEEGARLRDLEQALDQCWDLLRRRRAARGLGEDPDSVTPRPVSEVEGYLQ
jgi:hypothetical protein